jgi:hypothetical protein
MLIKMGLSALYTITRDERILELIKRLDEMEQQTRSKHESNVE